MNFDTSSGLFMSGNNYLLTVTALKGDVRPSCTYMDQHCKHFMNLLVHAKNLPKLLSKDTKAIDRGFYMVFKKWKLRTQVQNNAFFNHLELRSCRLNVADFSFIAHVFAQIKYSVCIYIFSDFFDTIYEIEYNSQNTNTDKNIEIFKVIFIF